MATLATLRVNPRQLAKLATNLDQLVKQATGEVPRDTVQAAGLDDISKVGAAWLNNLVVLLDYLITLGLNVVAFAGYAIGAAGEQYSRADADGRITIAGGGGGGEIVPNPVVEPTPIRALNGPPAPTAVPTDIDVDPEIFAQELEGGPGVGPADQVRGLWRDRYIAGANIRIAVTVDETTRGLREWESVGAEIVAPAFERFRTWHDNTVGRAAITFVQLVDAYIDAFNTARNNHPSAADIRKAKRRLEQARTWQETADAWRDLDQVMNRAREAEQAYLRAIKSGVLDRNVDVREPEDIAKPTSTAVNREIPPRRVGPAPGTNGTQANRNQNGDDDDDDDNKSEKKNENNGNNALNNALSSLLQNQQPVNTAATTDPAAAQIPTTTGNQANAAIPPLGGLPMANQGLQDPNAGLTDGGLGSSLDDLPVGNYAGSPSGYFPGGLGGGWAGAAPPKSDARGVPLSGTSHSGAAKLASVARQFGLPGAGAGSKAGSGGMPYGMYPPPMGAGANPNGNGMRGPNPFEDKREVVSKSQLPEGLANPTINEKEVPVLPAEATRPTAATIPAPEHERATA